MMDKVSMICTVYNDQKEIESLLNDINRQTMIPDEIVIADGGSKDNTIELINNYGYQSKCSINLLQGKRLNISQGFNEAIKNTKNAIIIIMSTGHRYDENFINELYEKYRKTNADIVFAPIRGNNKTKFSKLYNQTFLKGKYGSRIPSNHGVLVKKDVFKKIGLFYEKFIYAGEDAEFFDRARANNLYIECAENAIMEWDVPNNLKQFQKQVKGYTIAKMQIESLQIIKKYKLTYILLVTFITSLALLLFKQYFFGSIFFFLYLLILIYRCLKSGIRSYILKHYRELYEIKIIMQNLSKLNKQYKVDKKVIEKLN